MQHSRPKVIALLGALLLAAAAGPALAGSVLVYEGLLQESDGSLVTHATHGFDFTLYGAPDSFNPLWRELHSGVLVENGRYAVTLGLVVPLDLPEGEYWLEITVDGEVMTPRTKVELAKGNCTIDGNLWVLNGAFGVGTSTPHHEAELYGNDSEAGLRLAWGPAYSTLYADFKMATSTGLTINSNAGGGTWADMHLQTNGTTKLYIDSTGKVGIGTTGPGKLLTVEGGEVAFNQRAWVGDFSTDPGGTDAVLNVHHPTGSGNLFRVTYNSFPAEDALVVTGTGRVGIGRGDPGYLVHLSGGAYSNGTSWVNASSRDLKQDINDLSADDALEVVAGLRPVTFRYRSDPAELEAGFIAEEVPELVATADRKGLTALDIVAALTKVVQLQQQQIDSLQAEMARLGIATP
jgi:hypothetical protein